MKSILIPTDFSKAADNAIDYAAEIGKITRAKLILFHVFQIPMVATEVPLDLPGIEQMKKECELRLKDSQERLYQRHGTGISVQCECQYGFVVEEIDRYAFIHKIDLIVMGMQGAGFLAEKLMGSITSSLIHKSKYPVLAIDHDVRFRSIRKITLACDYVETENRDVFKPLVRFAGFFNAHVFVLNIVRDHEPPVPGERIVADFMNLDHALENVEHSFHHLNNDHIVEGINEFVSEGDMDMVVMISRKHSFLKNIFREPNTRQMVFHSRVPFLALHG